MKKLLSKLSLTLVCLFIVLKIQAQNRLEFLNTMLQANACSDAIFQVANCGDQVFEISACNDSDKSRDFIIEVNIILLSPIGSFNFTDPMDFSFNSAGNLEAKITLPPNPNFDPTLCTILRFKGTSGNYDPKVTLNAEARFASNNSYYADDCTLIAGSAFNQPPISNTSVSQAIANKQLFQMPNASNFPQNVIIEGNLVVDQNYTFAKSSNLQLLENANIIVESGSTLTLLNNNIFGCEQMWESITVRSGGTLKIFGGKIRDGLKAVRAEADSKVIIENALFEDNEVSVQQEAGANFVRNYNNIFKGRFTLKNGNPRPSAAIQAEFNSIVSASYCSFLNLYNGILGTQAIINTNNNFFENIGVNDLTKHHGIYNLAGLLRSENDNFEKQENAISNVVGNAKINGCSILSSYNGISSSLSAYLRLDDFFISSFNNAVTGSNMDELTSERGFITQSRYGYGLSFVRNGLIKKNDISADDNIGIRYGVQANSCSRFDISDNNISFKGIVPQNTEGVFMVDPSDFLIENNTIGVDGDSDGLICQGGINNNIGCNSISGTGLTYYDAYIEQSGGNSAFYCNTLSGGLTGIKYEDACISRFAGNQMLGNAEKGLYIGKTGVIGEQVHKGNLWFSPISQCDNQPKFSRFKVSARHNSNKCIKIKEHIPDNQVGNTQWFTDECEEKGISTYACASNCFNGGTKPPFVFTEDPKSFYLGLDGTPDDKSLTYSTRRQYYIALKENSEVLEDADPSIKSFVNEYEKLPVGRLFALKTAIDNLNNTPFSDEVKKIDDELLTLIDNSKALDKEINNAGEETKDFLLEHLQDLNFDITSKFVALNKVKEAHKEYKMKQIESLIAENQSIEPTNEMEVNEKLVNDFQLNFIEKGIHEFTDEELLYVAHIAWQCPLTGGAAVYRARSLYALKYPEQGFDDYNTLCNTVIKTKVMRSQSAAILDIAPNPTGNAFSSFISLDSDNIEAQAILVNSNGQSVANQNIYDKQARLSWNTSNLPSGIYSVIVKNNGVIVQQKRVVIAH